MNHDHHLLWSLPAGRGTTACVMVSCCGGAELQVITSNVRGDEDIVLRELYPDRASLYERARALRSEIESQIAG